MDTNITQSPEDVKVLIITNIAVNADQINPQISTSATAMFCGAFDTCGAGKGGRGRARARAVRELRATGGKEEKALPSTFASSQLPEQYSSINEMVV